VTEILKKLHCLVLACAGLIPVQVLSLAPVH